MTEFAIALENADTIVRIEETRNFISQFFDNDIDIANEGFSFKEAFSNFKEAVKKFFIHLGTAVRNFFLNLFGKAGNLYNIKGINQVKQSFDKTYNDVNSIFNAVSSPDKVKNENTRKAINTLISKIKDDLAKDRVQLEKIIVNNHKPEDFKNFKKEQVFNIDILNKKIDSMTQLMLKFQEEFNRNNVADNVENTEIRAIITALLNFLSFLNKQYMEMIILCKYSKSKDGVELNEEFEVEIL